MDSLKTTLPILLMLAAVGCSGRESESMMNLNTPALMAAAVPPIDAAAPAKVETATFAVG